MHHRDALQQRGIPRVERGYEQERQRHRDGGGYPAPAALREGLTQTGAGKEAPAEGQPPSQMPHGLDNSTDLPLAGKPVRCGCVGDLRTQALPKPPRER